MMKEESPLCIINEELDVTQREAYKFDWKANGALTLSGEGSTASGTIFMYVEHAR